MKRLAVAIAILGVAMCAPAHAATKTPVMDKFAKFFYEIHATKKPQPFPLTDEEITKVAEFVKEANAKKGIPLNDRQALFLAGAVSLLGSQGYPLNKAADNFRKAMSESNGDANVPVVKRPAWLPEIDSEAYCANLMSGSGAALELTCRKQEARALDEILRMDVDPRAGKYCGNLMKDSGYAMIKTCIEQEHKALKEMGK